jgi:hypothetical protein
VKLGNERSGPARRSAHPSVRRAATGLASRSAVGANARTSRAQRAAARGTRASRGEERVKSVETTVSRTGAILNFVITVITGVATMTAGWSPFFLGTALLGLVLSVVLWLVTKMGWLEDAQLHRASVIILVVLVLTYCTAPFYVEVFGMPTGYLSWAAILWILVVVTECSILARVSAPDSSDRRGQVALFVAVSLMGTSLLGLASALGGLSLLSFQERDLPTAWSLLGNATALTALGLTVLLARRLVVAMALFSYAPVTVGFGLSTLLDGLPAYGYSLVGVGVLSAVLGVAIAFGNATSIGLALGIGAVGSGICAITVAGTPVPGTTLSFTLLTIALAVTGTAFFVWQPQDPWRQRNDMGEWTSAHYRGVALLFFGVTAVISAAAVATATFQRTGATSAFVALSVGSFTVATITTGAGLYARRIRRLTHRSGQAAHDL